VFISRLLEIQYNNYDIFALKMFTIPPPCQSPELGGIRPHPQLPVERTILNRLGNVVVGNLFGRGQVRNCPRDFQNPVVGAR
jgi:hypothetical protein